MGSNAKKPRRWVTALGLTAALGAGLVLAENAAAPAAVGVRPQSVAFSSPLISRLPAPAPGFTAAAEPTVGAQNHTQNHTAICESLLNARQVILNTPDSPQRDAALAQNSQQLAANNCTPISGN